MQDFFYCKPAYRKFCQLLLGEDHSLFCLAQCLALQLYLYYTNCINSNNCPKLLMSDLLRNYKCLTFGNKFTKEHILTVMTFCDHEPHQN
jgi:hypothetical protein